jgi:hypothetical protein
VPSRIAAARSSIVRLRAAKADGSALMRIALLVPYTSTFDTPLRTANCCFTWLLPKSYS